MLLWLLASVLLLLLFCMAALKVPAVRDRIAGKASDVLSSKLNTKVRLKGFDIGLLRTVSLHQVYAEDQQGDTLLSLGRLSVNVDLMGLLNQRIDLELVEAEDLVARVERHFPDTNYNYSFILSAFAGEEEEAVPEADTASSPWTFTIGKVNISSTRLLYADDFTGVFAKAAIGELETSFDDFDLDGSKIVAGDLLLAGSTVRVEMSEPREETEEDGEPTAPWVFGANSLLINNTRISYRDKNDSSSYTADISGFELAEAEIDLGTSAITAGKLALTGSTVDLFLPAGQVTDTTETIVAEKTDSIPDFSIKLGSLYFSDNNISYSMGTAARKTGFDPSHMALKGLFIDASDLSMENGNIDLTLADLRLKEKGGLQLKEFSGKLHYHDGAASLNDFILRTAHTTLRRDLAITYSSIEELTTKPASTTLNINIDDAVLGMRDLYYFMPALSGSLGLAPSEKIKFSLKAEGTLADLETKLALSWRESSVRLLASVKNALSPDELYADVQTFAVKSGKSDLLALLPAGSVPTVITLPADIALEGSFRGYLKNFDATAELNSSLGSFRAKVEMDPAAGNRGVPYKGAVHTTSLELGSLLNNKDLGQLTFSVAFNGQGMDTSDFDTHLDLHLVSLFFKGYNYRDLTMKGHLLKSAFSGSAKMRDDNLAFDFEGLVNLDKTEAEFGFRFSLLGADLKKLNLTEDDMRLSTVIQSDMAFPADKNPRGKASIHNLLLVKEGRRHRVDSLVLTSKSEGDNSIITLASEKLTARMEGVFLLQEIVPSVQSYINDHFYFAATDSIPPPQSFTFSLNFKDPSFLSSGLVPGLEKITPGTFSGAFNSSEKRLSASVDFREIIYNGIRVDSLKFNLSGNADALNYGTTLSQVSDSANFKFENLRLAGALQNDVLSFDFSTAKDDSAKVAGFAGQIKSDEGIFNLRFQPNATLNSENWTFDRENLIVFGDAPLNIRKLVLSNGAQGISLNHTGTGTDVPLEISFRDFELATFSGMMEHSELLVSGRTNGQVVIETQNGQSAFRSDLKIADLKYKSGQIGNITLKADNFTDPATYDLLLTVAGNNNDVVVDGAYRTAAKNNKLDLDVVIRSLQLASVEPFAAGQVTQMTGWISGKLKVSGEPASPVLNGVMNMHELGFRPKIIDSYLRLPGGELRFNSPRISMDKIVVFDTLSNRAELGGFVDIGNLSKPSFDLKLKTKDFLALNTDKHDNELYFGKLFLDSDVRIYGTADRPTIDAKARLNDKSTLTYVKPEEQILKNESEGIVEFTDSLEQYTRIMTRDDSAAVKGIIGMELNAEITVDKGVEIKVLIDPMAGDSLYIHGGGKLSFTMDRNGGTALSGKYTISKGGYFLTISDLVKRDFAIDPGSSITWSDDPLDAYLDLSAIYLVKTSPIDLVQDQMTGITQEEANKYRNLLSFQVFLKMTGFLSSPQISFDIKLAPKDRGAMGGVVNTRLAQLREDENQLNKQVFALLTLRRFVSENPLESSGGGGLSSAGRASASKVLTQQLNTLSDRYVDFVDLDLGVNSYEDYSSGQQEGRTQLQVGVSKQLFDERVTVRVGGNVDVEGEKARKNTANDVAGNVSIEYKLTEDGRYKLKAFRENQYENPIEGEIIKTGAGFVFSRDFNRFKNLFRKPRSERNAKKEDE